jgi:hypothetical protein
MKPWLEGDLGGVDPRADLDRLRDAVLGAAMRGEDSGPLFRALGRLDPRACADLAAGPRAVAHRAAVESAFAAADAIEQVLEPGGLYRRWVDLAPDSGAAILAFACRRHPLAEWAVRLSRQVDPVPGRIHLASAAEVGRLREACTLLAEAGQLDGLLDLARQGDVEPIGALWRAHRRDEAIEAAAACLDAVPLSSAIPALAALAGPAIREVLRLLLVRVHTPAAAERVRWARVDAS